MGIRKRLITNVAGRAISDQLLVLDGGKGKMEDD